MLSIILTGHGGFASGMEKAMKQILGEQSQFIGSVLFHKIVRQTYYVRKTAFFSLCYDKNDEMGKLCGILKKCVLF